jgi:hypothetical protein
MDEVHTVFHCVPGLRAKIGLSVKAAWARKRKERDKQAREAAKAWLKEALAKRQGARPRPHPSLLRCLGLPRYTRHAGNFAGTNAVHAVYSSARQLSFSCSWRVGRPLNRDGCSRDGGLIMSATLALLEADQHLKVAAAVWLARPRAPRPASAPRCGAGGA